MQVEEGDNTLRGLDNSSYHMKAKFNIIIVLLFTRKSFKNSKSTKCIKMATHFGVEISRESYCCVTSVVQ